jgi:hypothetical protein
MSRAIAAREFLARAWLVVGAGLLATFGLLYALSAVGRAVGSEALAAAGLAVTFLNIVAVVGAGHGIRLLRTFFAAGPQRAVRLAVVRSRVLNARDASVVLVLVWVLVGAVTVAAVARSSYFALAWLVSLPGFALAPWVAVNGSIMQLVNQESRILRSAAVAVLMEVCLVSLLVAVEIPVGVRMAAILAAGQLGTVGVLFTYRRWLRRHEGELWEASRLRGGAWFGEGWSGELRSASFTAWDALAIMGYYAVAVAVAGVHSAQSAAAVALVASVNRAIIVPLKSAGLVGGRLVRQGPERDQRVAERQQQQVVAVIMGVVAVAVVLAGQFSGPLAGIPRSVGAAALAVGGCQLLLEPWVGFASGQGKVLYDSGFAVAAISGSVGVVAAPLMLLLVQVAPASPLSYVLPFVVARVVALVLIARERRTAQGRVATA